MSSDTPFVLMYGAAGRTGRDIIKGLIRTGGLVCLYFFEAFVIKISPDSVSELSPALQTHLLQMSCESWV